MGSDLTRLVLDTKLGAYLLDPADTAYSLPDLLRRHVGMELATDGAAAVGQLDLDGTSVDESQIVAREALAVSRIAVPLLESLEANGLTTLNDDIEVPLVRVLAHMEHLGVGVDVEVLRSLNASLTAECETERAAIVAAARRPGSHLLARLPSV